MDHNPGQDAQKKGPSPAGTSERHISDLPSYTKNHYRHTYGESQDDFSTQHTQKFLCLSGQPENLLESITCFDRVGSGSLAPTGPGKSILDDSGTNLPGPVAGQGDPVGISDRNGTGNPADEIGPENTPLILIKESKTYAESNSLSVNGLSDSDALQQREQFIREVQESENYSQLLENTAVKTKYDWISQKKTWNAELIDFVLSNFSVTPGEKSRLNRVKDCGSWVNLHYWLYHDKTTFHAANFCNCGLCFACQVFRQAKKIQAVDRGIRQILFDIPHLIPVMFTATIRDQENLPDALAFLIGCRKTLLFNRVLSKRDNTRNYSEFSKVAGGVFQIEIKRGIGSGLWHPHIHGVLLLNDYMDLQKFGDEWERITGGARSHYIKKIERDHMQDSLLEVLRYSMKVTDVDESGNVIKVMSSSDIWECHKATFGRQLFTRFGCLRNLKISDELTETDLDGPYVAIVMNYVYNKYFITNLQTEKNPEKQKEVRTYRKDFVKAFSNNLKKQGA